MTFAYLYVILLCKYYIYLKYYCSLAKKAGIKQDFTAKQFLTAIGYSTKSQKQIDKISTYNKKKHRNPFQRTSTGAPDLQFPTDIELNIELFKFLIVP